jgi:phage terminase large subunit-like protein
MVQENTHETSKFEDEYLRFPKATHDDMLDSLAYQLDIAYSPRRVEKKKTNYKPVNIITGY